MASQKHTQEPWKFLEQADADEYLLVTVDEMNWVIAFRMNGEMMPERQRANCRRIVACVNACAGIETEMLKTGGDKIVIDAMATLITQRDELLAALKSITPLASEAMTMFQQQRGMMCQDIAKRLGKPVLAAERIINKIDHE